jgi:hypothetical protein
MHPVGNVLVRSVFDCDNVDFARPVVRNFDTQNRPGLWAAMGLLGWSDH